MKTAIFAIGLVALAALGSGCAIVVDADSEQASAAAKTQAPMLNLSHIECAADGTVTAHFVLLFNGASTPGTLTGTYNGGSFGPVSSYKTSGNVWHYNVTLPSGYVDILSAQVTAASGALVTLHNPEEYAGNYQCGPTVEACPVVVTPSDVYCTDKPLGNEGDECGNFGLVPAGKDDGLTGLTFTATMSAYVAIVKSGNHGCASGDAAYRIYVNVVKGQVLSTPADQNISHVTYCACPQP
jgi:hypothetical protein